MTFELSHNEKGVAAIEFVLVVPAFILITLFSVVEVGSAVIAHQEITEVAKEGARLLARTAALNESPQTSQQCEDNGTGASITGERSHTIAHRRMCLLMKLHGYELDNIEIFSDYDRVGTDRDIRVVINTSRRSPVFGTKFFPLSVERTSPHLLKF